MARAEDPLAAMGLSGRQYTVLAVLSADAPPSQLELAGLCGLLPAQIVPVIDELERRGLVARQRSETDRRRSRRQRSPRPGAEIARTGRRAGPRRWSTSSIPRAATSVVEALSRSYNTARLSGA